MEILSTPHYTEKTARSWLQTCLGDIQQKKGKHQASRGFSPATSGINQHSPLGRLTLPPTKKKLNNKQGTEN
jgi:hypothetical protein